MEDQQFCLKWSNHRSNMMDIFGRLLTNEALCDVTLACDGFSFKAHKLVLSASSSFFQTLFLENPCTHPVIILPELKYMDVKALVDFMYNGQINVSESQLPKLLKAAENLRIKGLSDCRLQNSSNHSDSTDATPEASFIKTNCSSLSEEKSFDQSKKVFEKDSDSSCNLEFREPPELCTAEMSCKDNEESTSNQQDSRGKSTNVVTLGPDIQVSTQVTDGSEELSSISDSEIEMEPSRMMEQSMTTDQVFKTQHSNSNPASTSESAQTDVASNINSEDGCTNLSETIKTKEIYTSAMCFTQNLCSSKDETLTVENTSDVQLGFANTSSSSKEFTICKKELDISTAGPSTLAFETSISQNLCSQGSMYSFGDDGDLKNAAKRGRRPGSRLCVLCKHIFHSESELEKHMENHKNDSQCFSESKKFPDEIESSDSQVISEKNLVRLPVSCATCNCMLSTMSDAQSHLSMNPNCRTSQFKCLLCPKLFIWPATLIKHFREQHQGPGGTARVTQRLWFFCDICKKPLLSKHALCLHRSKFHGFSSQSLGSESSENSNACKRGRKQGTRVCRLCKRTFTSTEEYHSHLEEFHRNNMLFNTALETASYVNESLSSTENESNSAQSVI